MNFPQGRLTVTYRVNPEATLCCEDLVLAAKAGSHVAFEELQKIHSRRIYKRILSITRSHEDAEDVLQDAFLRAYLALPSFQGRSKFSTWLTRIAINSALISMRKDRSRPKTSFDQQRDLEDDTLAFDVCDNAPNPEQVCDQKQRLSAILRAVERLDPKLQAPIHHLIDDKRSMKEMAHHLRISVAYAKARIHRARQRLEGPILAQRQMRGHSISRLRESASYSLG